VEYSVNTLRNVIIKINAVEFNYNLILHIIIKMYVITVKWLKTQNTVIQLQKATCSRSFAEVQKSAKNGTWKKKSLGWTVSVYAFFCSWLLRFFHIATIVHFSRSDVDWSLWSHRAISISYKRLAAVVERRGRRALLNIVLNSGSAVSCCNWRRRYLRVSYSARATSN